MPGSHADATLTINLAAIAANYHALSKRAKEAECAAVVKANAYGLGVRPVAKALAKAGVKTFFVAHLEEGIELREVLPKARIFVFHGVREKREKFFCEYRLIPVLNDVYQIDIWRDFSRRKKEKLSAAVHIDTGMNRLGFSPGEIERLDVGELDVKLVMSHLACASDPDSIKSDEQYRLFNAIRKKFPGIPASLANSAGILAKKCYHFDLVRPGIALYGSNKQISPSHIHMRHVVTLTAPIIQLRRIDTPGTVGYGATREVAVGARLATIPVGYADGYLRSLGNMALAYVAGHKAPVVGRVSMDLIVLDVTNVPESKLAIGTEVELIGEHCTIDDLAKQAGTIAYEIITRLGGRFRKTYVE